MDRKAFRAFAIAALLWAGAGCANDSGQWPYSVSQDQARTFFRLSVKERMKEFTSLPIDQQLSLYLVGMEVRHPPASYLGECYSLNGEKGMEKVNEAIRAASRDEEVHDLVILARYLDMSGYYDVVGDPEFARIAVPKIQRISDPTWREMAQAAYSQIGRERLPAARAASLCAEGRR